MLNAPLDRSWLTWSSKCINADNGADSDTPNILVISLPDFDSQVALHQTFSTRDRFIWLFSNLASNSDALPKWAVTDISFRRLLDRIELDSLTLRELSVYEAEVFQQRDINDAKRYMQLERSVLYFMKGLLKLTDKQTAYDFALTEFGDDAELVLGERPV